MRNGRRKRRPRRNERRLRAEPLEPRWLLAIVGVIEPNDTLDLTVPGFEVREDEGVTSATVTRGSTDIEDSLTVDLESDDTSEIIVPAQVVIPANESSVSFAITVVNDMLLDGPQEVRVTASAVDYQDSEVWLLVSDGAKLSVEVASAAISELGGATTATVSRDNMDVEQPLVVELSVSDDTQASVPTEVTILANETSATFQIAALDDNLLDGTQVLDVTARGDGYLDGCDQVSVTDYEQLLVVIADTSISESDGATTVHIQRPNADQAEALPVSLTVGLTNAQLANSVDGQVVSDPDWVVVPRQVEIPAGQGAVSVALEAVDDHVDADHPQVVITVSAPGYVDGDGLVDVIDDDQAGITVSAISGYTSEAGGTADFSIILDSQPTANVTIDVRSNDQTQGVVSPETIVFTPLTWDAAQVVTVTGVDDDVDDGDLSYTIDIAAASSDDPRYDGIDLTDVAVTNLDDDTAGITVSAISGDTTEVGDVASFTIVLDSKPTASVSIAVSSSDVSEGIVSPGVITFAPENWNVVQLVTVTGVDDDVDDGYVSYAVVIAPAVSDDGAYDGLDPGDLAVVNQNDDTAGITLSVVSGDTTEAGQAAAFTVVLDSEPLADVTIPLTSSDSTEGAVSQDSLTFTPYNWDAPQVVSVTGVDDSIDDGDMAFWIISSAVISDDQTYSQLDSVDVLVNNLDDDTSEVLVTAIDGDTSEWGDMASFSLVLASQPSGVVRIDFVSSDASEGYVTPQSVLFTPERWDTPQDVTVVGVDDDIDDGDMQYVVMTMVTSEADPFYSSLQADDVTVRNLDDDTVAIYVSSISGDTSEAGAEATFSVVLGSEPTAEVTIGLSSSDTTEGVVSVESVTFTSGDWDVPQMVTVTGVDDTLGDGDVAFEIATTLAVSLDFGYDGLAPDNVAVTNLDDSLDGLTWQNPVHPCDVTGDGWITSEDVLVLLTDINSNDTRQLPLPLSTGSAPPPYLDPSGDNRITPVDILLVIQYLNENGPSPAVSIEPTGTGSGSSSGGLDLPVGEGEAAAPLALSVVAESPRFESAATGLVGPRSFFQTDVDRSGSIPLPFHRANNGAERGIDSVMSEVDRDEGDRVSSVDLEGALSDIADDVNGIWGTL